MYIIWQYDRTIAAGTTGKYSCAKIGIIARNAISLYIYNLLLCKIYPNIVFFTPKYAI